MVGTRVTEYDSSSTAACSRFSRLTDQRLAFWRFSLFAVQQQRQANHRMVHRLVPNDVDDFIQRAERIPIHLNIAYGMCEGELGIGQRKSDRASPRSIPSQTMLGESALQSLAGQCLKCLVDLGGVRAATLCEVRLAAATTAKNLGSATDQIAQP